MVSISSTDSESFNPPKHGWSAPAPHHSALVPGLAGWATDPPRPVSERRLAVVVPPFVTPGRAGIVSAAPTSATLRRHAPADLHSRAGRRRRRRRLRRRCRAEEEGRQTSRQTSATCQCGAAAGSSRSI